MLPYFSGERTPIHDPYAKGMLFGLNLTHKRGDIYRALIEGIGYGTNHIFETYEDAGAAPKRLIAVGGGTRNRLWLEVTSHVSGRAQIVARRTIGASYGDACLAAIGVGDAGPEAITRWNPIEREILPVADSAYVRNYRIFKQLYQNTRHLMSELDR
jgi:xylulokinase